MKEILRIPIDATIRIRDEYMEMFHIPKIELIDDHEELWRFARFDRDKKHIKEQRYLVSSYGRVYDMKKWKMVPSFDSAWKNTKGEPYRSIRVQLGKKCCTYLLHRLVALSFIPKDRQRDFVNHIDGHPQHCWVWNLEWATLSENVRHAVRTGLKNDPRGELRPNAKWTDDEVRMICQMMEEGHKATYIYKALGDLLQDPKVQYERVRSLYKHIKHKTHWTHISKDYDIDFTPYNFSKEAASMQRQAARRA